ncbi:hypothetical protein [Clostridium sp. JN-9]|uniref:hypothetical protein n=1 Tax=Clostridium sp. JN-9 TaxID=2507159 RepID=UPI000FFE2CC1|nr:hypothetical protein [Clostridium sp. JN-9]QAT40860.1 hypothetical protein EQM05_11620 [Clostridium sp. JN-9]
MGKNFLKYLKLKYLKRKENEKLEKAYIEVKDDRDRLKKALEGTLCGMVVYAEFRDNEALESKINSYRRKAVEALKLSDILDEK